MSCKQIAIASEYPNTIDAPNPDPIANPSGKLCNANPILTIIPVFNNLPFVSFIFIFFFLLRIFCWTTISHIIITNIPIIVAIITLNIFAISKASGIKSKHTTAIINPAASDNIKLRNLLEVLLKVTPIIPPIVVPKVPKNTPIIVVFNKFSKIKTP